mmetsp:Transcript_70391/g.155680  ORF Transcript_70391/g.155680 Transcript_70391/m.155680 type:complete len:215 (+) Transcript_70391:1026-1670(+)
MCSGWRAGPASRATRNHVLPGAGRRGTVAATLQRCRASKPETRATATTRRAVASRCSGAAPVPPLARSAPRAARLRHRWHKSCAGASSAIPATIPAPWTLQVATSSRGCCTIVPRGPRRVATCIAAALERLWLKRGCGRQGYRRERGVVGDRGRDHHRDVPIHKLNWSPWGQPTSLHDGAFDLLGACARIPHQGPLSRLSFEAHKDAPTGNRHA